MSPDVTIHISIGPGGAITSQSVAENGASTEGPAPLSLGELQASGVGASPVPLTPEELSAVTTEVSAGTVPVPMPIEQLQARTVAATPEPQPLGTLEGVGGPPIPRPPEEIAALANPTEPPAPEQSVRSGGGKRSPK